MQASSITTASVIGLGYIGLPTAAMFASRKIKVIGVDVNQHAVDTINQGKIHIVEPELDMIVHAAVTQGYLRATTKPEPADVFLIAVPTPFMGDHEPDLTYVKAAVESIAPVLKKGDIVILESTSPVGTTEKMLAWLTLARPDLRLPVDNASDVDINIAYCPERVLPGHVVRELVENDRIIGGLSAACSEKAADVYRIFVKGKLLISNARTAEMCKLTENAFRDVNIAFANELSLICAKLDINPWELIKLANHHPRVNILQPGCGVGGHCIAVDPWFIVDKTPEEARMIRTAREVNDHKPAWVLGKIHEAVAALTTSGLEESAIKVAVLGLAFKPNIDDLRESPALHIAKQFAQTTRSQLLLVEPNIKTLPEVLASHKLVPLDDALVQADVVVFLVNHREFAGIKTLLNPQTQLVDAIGIDFI
ncbi:UDP-N-acetyl-D-mannosaminuronic acid dehydrogenase [Crenothrix polyspora]|uniref:UDP-N-acetyl-D-mannosaminuronic acid dehydrogenase n=1 Tax=Crenothrix polyspora TaxID=360316 RepID=A0A1R4H725_9GAMM|nr:UDP-N-acetyl-D-mannosamine dehydrogenase [Crenothrix polyspora]SJM91650.1 UDP-N-acetyl-D-mannosaminuronic acid dehydrogenase [Crenothrix polyspora]